MITSLRCWNTLNNKISKECVQRERKRQRGTHFFFEKKYKKIKNNHPPKKKVLLTGHRAEVTCCPVNRVRMLLTGFASKVLWNPNFFLSSPFSFFRALKRHLKIHADLNLWAVDRNTCWEAVAWRFNDEEKIRRLFCTSGSRGGRWLLRLLLYNF